MVRAARGRPSATPTAVETMPSMPASPRLPTTKRCSSGVHGVAMTSRSRTGFDEPTTSVVSATTARAHDRRDGERRQAAVTGRSRRISLRRSESRVDERRPSRSSASRQASNHAGSSALLDPRHDVEHAGDPAGVGGHAVAAADGEDLEARGR